MELRYPINLIGVTEGETSGDVLTQDGEFLGTWALTENPIEGDPDGEQGGVLKFIADSQDHEMITREFAPLGSGMLRGLAMSELCADIRKWHESNDTG